MSGSNKRNSDDKGVTQTRGMMGRGHGPGMMGNVEKAKDARGALSRLLGYLQDYTLYISVIIVFS